MSAPDLVLYRKYRPAELSQVLGQDHIVKALEGAIAAKQTAHAYLFAGARGTGKTSVARILARRLGADSIDVHEIDAASNRGIDEVRALREAVRVLPFQSPVKVYIVDEVHMLTKEAFNALLKTLEEPPPHAVFVLATTEHHKLPETILSRCQTFFFKKPTLQTLSAVVTNIAQKENLMIEPAAARLVAFLGDGSFRDALGVLQKAMPLSAGGRISEAVIEESAAAPPGSVALNFLHSLLLGDKNNALALVHKVEQEGKDFKVFIKLVLYRARLFLLYAAAPDLRQELEEEMNETERELAKAAVLRSGPPSSNKTKDKHVNVVILPTIIRELLNAYQEIDFSVISALPLELAIIRIISEPS